MPGLSLAAINDSLSIAWGSSYVNDFIDRGRVKRVYMQGEPSSRMNPEDLGKWYVRNDAGEMVPFTAFASGEWTYGPPKLTRFNGVPAMEILGSAAPGYSSGEAMAAVERIAEQLPAGIGYSWTGQSYEERLSGSQAPALYALSLLVVFLALAALYESWAIPFSVMLVVPLGTPLREVVRFCGGLKDDSREIIMGGPMMGRPVASLDVPVLKGCSGVLVFTELQPARRQAFPCIRCGRCLEACPYFLNPSRFARLARARLYDEMKALHVFDCVECGSCTFACPSNIPIVQLIRTAKSQLRQPATGHA